MAAFRQLPILQFEIGDTGGIETDKHHHRQKLAKSIRLVKAEDEGHPVFGVVLNHARWEVDSKRLQSSVTRGDLNA